MSKVQISLISLGNLKCPFDDTALKKWSSKLFCLKAVTCQMHIENSSGARSEYTDARLDGMIKENSVADITIALINARLEGNFYIRRVGSQKVVISLYEMDRILEHYGITVEHFILRYIYAIVTLYRGNGNTIPENYMDWAHDECRKCLFDKNVTKFDIHFSMNKPVLCIQCEARLAAVELPERYLIDLKKELTKIKKANYRRIMDWVKANPLWALTITFLGSIISGVLASVLYEGIKAVWKVKAG